MTGAAPGIQLEEHHRGLPHPLGGGGGGLAGGGVGVLGDIGGEDPEHGGGGGGEGKESDSEEDSEGDDDDDDDDDDVTAPPLEGTYDPSEYENLNVSPEIKELFTHVMRYTPQTIDLETRFKPFIPEYIPAVGDIDAFIKVMRPDGKNESLGLTMLDEPAAKQVQFYVTAMRYLHFNVRSI